MLIEFTLSRLTKSRKMGSSLLTLTFQIFDEDPHLCVVRAIRDYLNRSSKWRERGDIGRHQLMLIFVEPHKSVVSCTVEAWLVRMLCCAGINTKDFKAHSTRGASTSKAQAKGLSCKEILEAARWSKATTFRRHYLRNIAKQHSTAKFQHTVLS